MVHCSNARLASAFAVNPANAQETSTAQADSKVILVSGKQINSEIHKVSEVGPGTFRVELMAYNAKTGGADVLRRTKPYRAEVHKRLVDMWYVIEGEGTLVTGGSLSEPTQTEADEFRGPTIVGGEERHIAPGDFVRIPAGVPHWIRKIEGTEIIYLVVKAP
jgi:mannose-6-phosphate isomerase-like protein (cupin superfamily)